MTYYPNYWLPDYRTYSFPSWWYTTTTQTSGKVEAVGTVGSGKVTDLGEDGGQWFIDAPEDSSISSLRWAVLSHIQENYGDSGDEYITELEALAVASLEYREGWWATGHYEGQWVTDEEPPKKTGGWFVGLGSDT